MAGEEIHRHTNPTGSPNNQAIFLGLRVSALREILLFIIAALIVDFLIGAGDRFSGLSPHPFWIVVLLSSSYYGTNEGLVAAAFSTAALLIGNVPDQALDEDLAAWLLRITTQPVLWFAAALVLGEICVARRHEAEQLDQEVKRIQAQADVIAQAYEQAAQSRQQLEMHIASQQRTVRSLVAAAQAIEQPSGADILRNIPQMVRAVLSPQKFSLFLARERTLEMFIEEGWEADDQYWRCVAQGPLLESIMDRRQPLTVLDPVQTQQLCGQGLLAAPLIEGGTGRLIGMLKIEKVDIYDLNLTTVMDFMALCDWIGQAFERANRLKAYEQPSHIADSFLAPRHLDCEVERAVDDNILLHIKRDWPRSTNTTAPNIIAEVPGSNQIEIEVDRERKPAAKRRSTT